MKQHCGIFLLLTFCSFVELSGQNVVWTEPAFPNQLDSITVFFDASKGNAALEGFNGAVYAHTGVITSASTTPNDWKHVVGNWGTADNLVLMQVEGNDIYSLSYNITDFYNIDPGETVLQLAFVFRNGDGSIVGRDTDGADIFYDVFPVEDRLFLQLLSPEDNSIFFEGDRVNLSLVLNKYANISILDNGVSIFEDSVDVVDLDFLAVLPESHLIDIKISLDGDIQNFNINYLVLSSDSNQLAPPVSTIPGINYYNEDSLIFSLVAPNKDYSFFLCPANSFQVDTNFRMYQHPNGDMFWIILPKGIFQNGSNCYQYLVDNITIADPFSEIVLDPWNDGGIDIEIMQNLPQYPEEYTQGIVTAFFTEQQDYNWEVENFENHPKEKLLIYEILLRDFLGDHSYISLIDTLDYLENLRINAIELMPIQEFEGNQSWGYNPNFHMAVDKYYGSPEQLKKLIDECHKRNISVILDVVFNHAFSQSPLCQLYWNAADFRPASDSPYLNEIAKHPFNVGYDFNHESLYTKKWVKRILKHWIEKFKFDGFRFDLSKGLTQTNSGSSDNLMSQYDQSRIDILKDYADFIWSLDSDAYVICEHFAENSEEKVLSEHGMLLWGNASHQFAEAAMGYSSNFSGANYQSRSWDDPHLIAYAESHDEERLAYKIKKWGNSNADYDTKGSTEFPERIVATNLMYLAIPGPKMFWQFGELGYDFSINRCEDGSISDDCRLSPKPIRWDYFNEEKRHLIYNKISAITFLRDSLDAFTTTDFSITETSFTKRIFLNGSDVDVLCLANFDIKSSEINPDFPNKGTWYEYFTGEEVEVSDINAPISLPPGAYRVYLTDRVLLSDETFNSDAISFYPAGTLFPNPVPMDGELSFVLYLQSYIQAVHLTSISGQKMVLNYSFDNSIMKTEIPNSLSLGIYIIEVLTETTSIQKKIIITH